MENWVQILDFEIFAFTASELDKIIIFLPKTIKK